MPIHVAEHEVEVRPNHVYLLPPRKEITIKNGLLCLRDKDPTQALNLPIDLFFRSLAADVGSLAVAVVLSGSGSDGSRGIRDIKRHGGLVLAESPETAKFNGMPLSTLATGLVDYSGPSAGLAEHLIRLSKGQPKPEDEGEDQDADELPIDAILRLLRGQFGLDFAVYKRSTVVRRVVRRMGLLDADDIENYVMKLRTEAGELSSLYHDLLIGVTQFFRDPEAFEILEKRVIPQIVEQVPETEEIRCWVAGCATGEEPYSIAMLLFEELSARDRPIHFKVLATDVHRASLERGSQGFYGEEQLQHVSQARRRRFFTKHPNGYQISQDLRQRIVFAPHNVTQDAPFTKMHLISCRNLLIYLEPDAQKTVISLLHFGLTRGGFLFLGSSETVGPFASEFDAIDEHWKIHRKERDVRLLDPLRLPTAKRAVGASAQLLGPTRSPGADPHLMGIYDRLLDRYMPPGFLVDEERNLVDSFSGAERYLRVGRRRPSSSILDLLEGDLRTAVAAAVQRVLGAEHSVRYTGVPLSTGGCRDRVAVAAEVFHNPRVPGRHVLITLEPETSARDESQPPTGDPGDATHAEPDGTRSAERQSMLESELAYTRETLQAAIEEQQTSNEELQAANEELVASNEELQSTNEELHSVNEELYTVNGEYQKKLLELREVNNDMQHLLDAADVGTLFLDAELQIRKFTPRVASVFHIRPGDVGRNIADFTHDLGRPSLLREVSEVLSEGVTIEDEVQDCHGTTFFLRILPYRPAPHGDVVGPDGDATDGVLLSLTDISALDHARARIKQLSAIVESSDDAILAKDLEGTITTWNGGAERLYGYTAEEAVGQNIRMLAPPEYKAQVAEFIEAVKRGERIEHVETVRKRKDGTLLDVSVTISPIHDAEGTVLGASAIARDITSLQRAQREVEEREAHIRLLLDSTAEAIYGLAPDGTCTFCNPACVRMLGYESADALIGKQMHELVHHTRADGTPFPTEECPIYKVLHSGEGAHSEDDLLYRADGTSFPAEYWSYPIRRNSTVQGVVVTFLDVTDRKRANEEVRLAAKRREQFLAMLSHELRNPLSAVLSATKVMQTSGSNPTAIQRARDVIERQSGHMARLLDDLLDVSRITRGGIELRKEDLDLRDPINLAVEAVGPQLEETKTTLELDLAHEPLPVRGDRTRLQQVVGNLLTNAIKYSPPGSHVVLSGRLQNDEVLVSIKDSGYGIEPSLLPDIFDLFVQTEQGLARSNGGLGVGLALVRQLVKLHGGHVEALSEGRDRGSEFRVMLPRLAHALLRPSGKTQANGPEAKRIVLVEDQDDAREMLKALLEAKGYIVFEARDGEEAIEVVGRVHPDAALIDIGLPLLDGFGVARHVRQNATLDDVILVALTGYGTEEDVRAAREAGFTEHLTKPADPLHIVDILSRKR